MMGKTQRGVRDGRGPFWDSYQSKTSKLGKRQQQGQPCPQKKTAKTGK